MATPQSQSDAVIEQDSQAVIGGEDQFQDPAETDQLESIGTASEEIDWKARALAEEAARKEYEQAFKGLQGTVQQLVESQRATAANSWEQQKAAARKQFEASLEGMTETEAKYARHAFELEIENRELRAAHEADKPLSDRLAREAVVNKIAKQYGVTPEFLRNVSDKYNHPYAVAAAAEAAHATRKQFEKPRANTRVEGNTGGSTGGDEAELAKLANSGNWEAYWTIIDRQSERDARRR
jgi:hypothetical protein